MVVYKAAPKSQTAMIIGLYSGTGSQAAGSTCQGHMEKLQQIEPGNDLLVGRPENLHVKFESGRRKEP